MRSKADSAVRELAQAVSTSSVTPAHLHAPEPALLAGRHGCLSSGERHQHLAAHNSIYILPVKVQYAQAAKPAHVGQCCWHCGVAVAQAQVPQTRWQMLKAAPINGRPARPPNFTINHAADTCTARPPFQALLAEARQHIGTLGLLACQTHYAAQAHRWPCLDRRRTLRPERPDSASSPWSET